MYVTAVAGRTSFAVAVPAAGDRFGAGSALLAAFVVLQLGVYAAAQVPVGLLLDRLGSRRVLAGGALVLALGQLLLATASTVPVALAARVLVGLGDATAFIGVLRLLPAWFALRRVPLLTQLTSIVGQGGQVVSAFPFMALIHARGWATAFLALGGTGLVLVVVCLAVVQDAPPEIGGGDGTGRAPSTSTTDAGGAAGDRGAALTREPVAVTLGRVVAEPGTWVGFFTHWLGMFPTAVFTLMWGVAWMTQGLGLGTATAAWVLTLNTLAGIASGPVAGFLSGRWPAARPSVVLAGAVVSLAAWTVALTVAGPLLAAAGLSLTVGLTAPFSSIGFDSARSFNRRHRWGTATGVVNMGGFTATILGVEAVGVVLDLRGGGRTETDFQLAFSCLVVVWLMGVVGLVISRRRTRCRVAALGSSPLA